MRETHAAKPHAYRNALWHMKKVTVWESFIWGSKVASVNTLVFAYFSLWLVQKKNNKHAPLPANQMRTNTNRFMNSLFVVTSSSDWLLVKFVFTLIGCYDNFGLGFTTLKALRSPNMKTFGIAMDVMSVRNPYVK